MGNYGCNATEERRLNPRGRCTVYELKYDPKISSTDVAVAVRDSVVTLSGYVSSYWEKAAAENAVRRVYGVKGVANDLQVRLSLTCTDPEIAREVEADGRLCRLT
jgi:hypothetical protein